MLKTIFAILMIVALAYAAYWVHERYFSEDPKLPGVSAEADEQTTPFICPKNVPAYDPESPSKKIGVFLKGTEIRLSVIGPATNMTPVTFYDPSGNVLHALCRTEDLVAAPSTNQSLAPKPLEGGASLKGDISGGVKIGDSPSGIRSIGEKKH